jgi:hypothetical protein
MLCAGGAGDTIGSHDLHTLVDTVVLDGCGPTVVLDGCGPTVVPVG